MGARLWCEVFQLLRGHDDSIRGARHLSLQGHKVCNRAWMKLVGLGKRRFATLQQGIKDQLEVAPVDGRYVPRGYRPQSEKAQIVHSFLMDLYLKAGEFLPDSGNSSSNKRPRQGQYKLDGKQLDRSKLRHLPPGRIADYHRLIQAENPDAKISKKLFSSVTWVNSISACII